MNNKIKLIFFLFSLGILLSCSKQPNSSMSEPENRFSTAVPLTDINKSLQIVLNSKETSFASGSEIELMVYNKSPYYLYFDNDSHMRLLGSSDNLHWIEVKNAITYSATMILSPQGTILLDTQPTWVKPILDQSSFDAKRVDFLLRIVIAGEIMDGDNRTGKKVGAYIDVDLKP